MMTNVAIDCDPAAVDVLAIGEALIDLFAPDRVSLSAADQLTVAPGGAPANVAAGVARLGGRSAFLGVVGEDPFGRRLSATLEAAAVDVSGLRFTDMAPTTLAFVAKREAHRSEFVFYRNPGADTLLTSEDIAAASIGRSRIIHFGGVSLSADPAREAVLAAAAAARVAGRLVAYDPNWRPWLWPDQADGRRRLLDAVTVANIVKLSDVDLEFLTGSRGASDGAARLLNRGPGLVVVTRGSAGAYLATHAAHVDVAGFAVQEVDATGCGDAFMAGLLVALLGSGRLPGDLDSATLAEIGRFANAAGALTATRKGGIPALPARAAVEAFLAA